LVEQVRSTEVHALPDLARSALLILADQLGALAYQVHALERRLLAWHRRDQASSDWRPSQAWGSSPPPPCLRPSSIPAPSSPAESSQPSGSGLGDRILPAARTGWA